MEHEQGMNEKKNIERTDTKVGISGRNWKESYLIFFVLPIVFTILFPLGGLFYLCGRFYPDLIFLSACMLYPMVGGFIIFCFFAVIVRCFRNWRSCTRKRKHILAAGTAIPIMFIILLLTSFFIPIESDFWAFGSNAFAHGFRERIRSEVDIEAVREWLKTVSKEDYSDYLPYDKWPDSLKVLNPVGAALSEDENGNPNVSVILGGSLPEWGLVIGPEDMKISSSAFRHYRKYRLPLEPGAYVWY